MPRPLDMPTVEMPASGSFNRFIPRKELSKKLGECPRSTKRRQDTAANLLLNGRAHHTDADASWPPGRHLSRQPGSGKMQT